MLGAIYVLSALLFPRGRWHRIAITLIGGVLIGLLHPIRAELGLGQADFLVLLLMTFTLGAFVRGHDTRAGLWLALATAFKPTVGFLVLWFLWKRSYRAAAQAGRIANRTG